MLSDTDIYNYQPPPPTPRLFHLAHPFVRLSLRELPCVPRPHSSVHLQRRGVPQLCSLHTALCGYPPLGCELPKTGNPVHPESWCLSHMPHRWVLKEWVVCECSLPYVRPEHVGQMHHSVGYNLRWLQREAVGSKRREFHIPSIKCQGTGKKQNS